MYYVYFYDHQGHAFIPESFTSQSDALIWMWHILPTVTEDVAEWELRVGLIPEDQELLGA